MPQQQNKERLLVFTSDGDKRLDNSAVKFHDSILSYTYALAFPARRPTRRWSFREEGRRPVSDGAMYVETTPPLDPGMDGEFLLKTIPSMWTAAYMGQNPRRWRLAAIPLPYVAMIITGVVLLMAMIWYMATTSGGEETPPPVPTPPPAVETSLAPPKTIVVEASRAPAETIQEAVMGDPGVQELQPLLATVPVHVPDLEGRLPWL